jgi:glycosyltransferase involved in cell wall biosynthesis
MMILQNPANKPKLLIFIVAYHAESTISMVLSRLPADKLKRDFQVEVLVIDDQSEDKTFEVSVRERGKSAYLFPIHILYNPVNQGYGGNQKIGFHYAIENGFDYVALIHGDGQYAPEMLTELMRPFNNGEADAVFGSRMITRGGAMKGGMPIYKYIGNKILTWTQNYLLGSQLSEFHSGYRVYSIAALRRIPFDLNTSDFHYDTEIIIQLMIARQRIVELPIPTYYGDEICRVNGIKYAMQVLMATLKAKLQRYDIFYDWKYDCAPRSVKNDHYLAKLGYKSSHSLAIDSIPPNSRVLDIGCGGGYVGVELRKKGCKVTGMDIYPLEEDVVLDKFHQADINYCKLPDGREFDYVIILDMIEHLHSPEEFMNRLKKAVKLTPDLKIIVTTGNIGFFVQRLMLLFGIFNYGRRGILDRTHTRLFTFSSMKDLNFKENIIKVA